MNSRLKELRKDNLKMTQEQFAESLGISRSNITNIELGNIALTDRMIKTICSVHNVNEKWLKEGTGDIFINNSNELDTLIGYLYAENDDFKKEIIKLMLELDDDGWKFIKTLVKNLKKISD